MSILNPDGLNMEHALEENGEVVATVSGTSMFPLLRNRRDMVVIEKVNRKLKKYDVPLYRLQSGKLVLHRILKVTDNGYIIRGDNSIHTEYNVTDDNIIGVLKSFYRNGKYFDCATSKLYKVYIPLNRCFFPLRFLWKKIILPFLVRIKWLIFGKKPNK